MTDWRTLRSIIVSWWYSTGTRSVGQEIRVAFFDARRAPGWIVLGMIAVFWPLSDWSLMPVIIAAAVWLAMMFVTRFVPWWYRRRVRRWFRPGIGLLALVVLASEAGVWAWLLAVGLWLIVAAVTDTLRARRRLLSWLLAAVARTARVDPAELHVERATWDNRRLVSAEVNHRGVLRTEDAASRARIEESAKWALRHAGIYRVSWPAGVAAFEIEADPPLPTSLPEMALEGLPGIPIGATDAATAAGEVDVVDAQTGQLVSSIPVALVNPADAQRHYLVVGGTGAGKSVFIRGFIARALRNGWFPGGVFIFDGKGGSDYIVFEGREGVHCVARTPEEWEENLPPIVNMMRQRYDEDAEYHRGNRSKPSFPRYLVVFDEVQEIRNTLGKDVLDPVLQQISRQMRASEGRLMLCTQRPDVSDAMPGAVRDMLEDRIVLGFISQKGAQMVMDQDWRSVVDEYGNESVPGRGMARIGGRLLRIQGFNLPLPREHPEVEYLYPRKLDAAEQEGGQRPPAGEQELPRNVARWAPRQKAPRPPEAPEEGQEGRQERLADEVDGDAPTPPHGIPRIGLAATEQEAAGRPEPPAEPAPAAPPQGPPDGGRRRRRTV
ncbi:type IV secretory system conjugative DNA transfer family protein [Amycolatopsis keratiniphila]|uniref:FtsK domain-containing protein n=1 Tax=Amycolatopsis keratiniphila subsp. keratiniphila TaxID=227715 RepID=A0A1W2M215_9PSEU|nr:DUF87 domain-containing protein [Amycolatopsis keratiniphila]ONF73948.1 hypothetical protein AVR91_0204255 [Amycolatopsis keratiniphila subsp. keratiniphila]